MLSAVTSVQFSLDDVHNSEAFPTESVKSCFQDRKDSLSSQMIQSVDDLFKDLDYINEMKQLEEQELSGQRSLHVVLFLKFLASRISSELCQVPISGLVIGYFCRLENECKTVLEVWEPVRYARSAATKVQRPELHKVSTMICCGHTLAPI